MGGRLVISKSQNIKSDWPLVPPPIGYWTLCEYAGHVLQYVCVARQIAPGRLLFVVVAVILQSFTNLSGLCVDLDWKLIKVC